MKKILLVLSALFVFSTILSSQSTHPKREFRGAWVATVANIDWPLSKYDTPGEQIKEMVEIFDSLKAAGINAIFFQIRTECDALYDSRYELWSYWLTGEQGKAPKPYYDPLKFAVKEAHKRGMELHAWFNPYRAVRDTSGYEVAENHVSKTHPEWILQFDNYKMLNPGLPGVREHILNVVSDFITRYDIEGIHFDDYFYPYSPKVSNEDSLTFAKFNRGITDIDDWRRDNINLLMKEIYAIIQSVKPEVKFGISPFGIVENKYAGTDGFESYHILYCDPQTWLEEKTVDYINPQLYWEIGHELADYAKLLPWWTTILNGRHLYVGHYSSKMMSPRYEGELSQIGAQIRMNRAHDRVHGSVFFSAKSIYYNWNSFADSLGNKFYKYPAFPPTMPWKDDVPPLPPQNLTSEIDSDKVRLRWELPDVASDGDGADYFVIYEFKADEEMDMENPKNILKVTNHAVTQYSEQLETSSNEKVVYVVTSMDNLHNESKEYAKVEVELNYKTPPKSR